MKGYQYCNGGFYTPGYLPPSDDYIEINKEEYESLISANHTLGHTIEVIGGKVVSVPRKPKEYTKEEVKELAPRQLGIAAEGLGWGDVSTLLSYLLDDSIQEATEAAKKFIAHRKKVYAAINELGDLTSQEEVMELFKL